MDAISANVSEILKNCIHAMKGTTAYFDEVKLPWKAGEAYDQWDAVVGALYQSLVAYPCLYHLFPDEGSSLGTSFPQLGTTSGKRIWDYIAFIGIETKAGQFAILDDIELLGDCRERLVFRDILGDRVSEKLMMFSLNEVTTALFHRVGDTIVRTDLISLA